MLFSSYCQFVLIGIIDTSQGKMISTDVVIIRNLAMLIAPMEISLQLHFCPHVHKWGGQIIWKLCRYKVVQ